MMATMQSTVRAARSGLALAGRLPGTRCNFATDASASTVVYPGAPEESKEELEARKRRSVKAYLEEQFGRDDPDRSSLAVLLQQHGVVVKGGHAEAVRLIEALVAWKRGDYKPDIPQ
ncbi:hypothetical protein HYH02_010109 [Chlamydomonas schloesseri]|uniref:Uncharacterized protein n=1 Tax=Chlamydomonas schloesseri TaxID=2026947 RepID=A0A835W9D8_9CHLO|nr:hypothetical protein HYH02_010109 [Chlamydomonas schloesseri]|eukprot:KAG2441266.1 hypothetical protein HYH02_010109 [Chlamydomonas schloesseri]